jgi:hypothetical protein
MNDASASVASVNLTPGIFDASNSASLRVAAAKDVFSASLPERSISLA